MPAGTKILAGAVAAAFAFFWWRRRMAKAGPLIPPTPQPQPPAPPVEEPIPPMTEEDADAIFSQAQASGNIDELTSIADTFFLNGYDDYGRQIELAINRYYTGRACNLVTCIGSQIEPNLNWLAQAGFTGLFGQLSAHMAIVIANAQAQGQI